nr:caspase-8-like protein [Arenicola marina]
MEPHRQFNASSVANTGHDAVPESRPFRVMLKTISDALSKYDIAALKFLCSEIIPSSKLESLHNGLGLLGQLEDRRYITPLQCQFLAELLFRIGRRDLVKRAGFNLAAVKTTIENGTSQHLTPYRVLLHTLSEQLSTSDVETLKFMHRDKLDKLTLEKTVDSRQWLTALEQRALIAPDRLAFLDQCFRDVGGDRHAALIQRYNEELVLHSMCRSDLSELPTSNNTSLTNSFPYGDVARERALPSVTSAVATSGEELVLTSTCRSDLSALPTSNNTSLTNSFPYGDVARERALASVTSAVATTRESPESRPRGHQERRDVPPCVDNQSGGVISVIPGECPMTPDMFHHLPAPMLVDPGLGVPRMPGPDVCDRDDPDNPCYNMTATPRGICLIINNEQFQSDPNDRDSKSLSERTGSTADQENLENAFGALRFSVHVERNLTAEDIQRLMTYLAHRVDHARYECLVCCILTHGNTGLVYGSDGKHVTIRDLLNPFKGSSCSSLLGKPKVFFIQACQGKIKQEAANPLVQTDTPGGAGDDLELPNEADFLLGYSTVPGYVSFRHAEYGTWFIWFLCQNLTKYAHKYHLLDILTMVNRAVARERFTQDDSDHVYKQMPAPFSTLRKRLFLA